MDRIQCKCMRNYRLFHTEKPTDDVENPIIVTRADFIQVDDDRLVSDRYDFRITDALI